MLMLAYLEQIGGGLVNGEVNCLKEPIKAMIVERRAF